MDWHHPDGGICAFDNEARIRFTKYIRDLNEELLTNYGEIDILWYDVPEPLQSWEGWDSLERNQYLRSIQPHIIINDRSRLPEDFGTPEGSINPSDRDWEACMTFNDISWGYIDEKQTLPYSHSAQQICKMLNTCCERGGNLLLNVGPAPDGSIPTDAIEPMSKIGEWLSVNGEAVYGKLDRLCGNQFQANGVSRPSAKGNVIYMWSKIWHPVDGKMGIGGFLDAPEKVEFMDGKKIDFEFKGNRIVLTGLPDKNPDNILGIPVIKFTFKSVPQYRFANSLPQLNRGLITKI